MSGPGDLATTARPPELKGLLETSLYVDDLARAARFYKDVVGLTRLFGDERLVALAVPGRSVLLLFLRGTTGETVRMSGGTIPPHDGHGHLHLAFAISREALQLWQDRLATCGIEIEGRMNWPKGGASIYVRDPDHHLVEFATPGLWPIR